MKNIAEVTAIMERISQLMRLGGREEWAILIDQYRSELARDTAEALSKIATLYGGMGSINDIVLYGDGQPLVRENNELDALLSRLYNLCVGSRS